MKILFKNLKGQPPTQVLDGLQVRVCPDLEGVPASVKMGWLRLFVVALARGMGVRGASIPALAFATQDEAFLAAARILALGLPDVARMSDIAEVAWDRVRGIASERGGGTAPAPSPSPASSEEESPHPRRPVSPPAAPPHQHASPPPHNAPPAPYMEALSASMCRLAAVVELLAARSVSVAPGDATSPEVIEALRAAAVQQSPQWDSYASSALEEVGVLWASRLRGLPRARCGKRATEAPLFLAAAAALAAWAEDVALHGLQAAASSAAAELKLRGDGLPLSEACALDAHLQAGTWGLVGEILALSPPLRTVWRRARASPGGIGGPQPIVGPLGLRVLGVDPPTKKASPPPNNKASPPKGGAPRPGGQK